MRKIIRIEELKKICEEYDYIHGIFPESRNEGKSVYNFVCDKLRNKNGR